jgi:LysR family transcriptional regulator, transcriptional activator for dmlA
MELYAVFAPGKPVPPRIRLFVDFLIRVFGELEQKLAALPL